MLNNVTLAGRMTADPELRYTAQNTAVCSFTLAVERDIKSDGEKQTDFIDCVIFGKSAETFAKYVHKGDMVIVQGRLQTNLYTDKNGVKKKATTITVEGFDFCVNKSEGTSEAPKAELAPSIDEAPIMQEPQLPFDF